MFVHPSVHTHKKLFDLGWTGRGDQKSTEISVADLDKAAATRHER